MGGFLIPPDYLWQHDRDGYAVCSAAAKALGRLGDRRAVEPLMNMLTTGCYECGREAAAEALGELGDLRAALALVALLPDPDAALRKIAAVALHRMGWKPPSAETRAMWLVAMQDWDGCIVMGRDAVPQLTLAINSADFDIAFHATNALNAINKQ